MISRSGTLMLMGLLVLGGMGSVFPAQVPDIGTSSRLTIATWDLDSDENITLSDLNISSGEVTLSSQIGVMSIKDPSEFSGGTLDNVSIGANGVSLANRVDWWDPAYRYRKAIRIHNMDGAALPRNFTMNLTMDTSALVSQAKMQADADDLRVVYFNGVSSQGLDRSVVSPDGPSTKVTFRTQANIPASSWVTDSYFVYYGNATVGNPPQDMSNIYLHFDDFSSDTLSSYTIMNNMLTQGGGTSSTTYNSISERIDILKGGGETGAILFPTITAQNYRVEAILNMQVEYNGGPRAAAFQMVTRAPDFNNYYVESFATADYNPELTPWVGTRQTALDTITTYPVVGNDYTIWMSVLNGSINGAMIGVGSLSGTDNQVNGAGRFGAGLVCADGFMDDLKAWMIAEQMPVLGLGNEEHPFVTEGEYTSAPLDAGAPVDWNMINWSADLPAGTSTSISTRTSGDGSAWSSWSLDLSTPVGEKILSPSDRYIQIKANLRTPDGSVTPVLDDIFLDFESYRLSGSLETEDLEVDELISWVSFNSTHTVPSVSGSSIDVFFSTDSGGNWDPVLGSGALLGVPTGSGKIRFRIDMVTGNTTMTPTLDQFNVSYKVNIPPKKVLDLDPLTFEEDSTVIGAYNLSLNFNDDEGLSFSAISDDANLTVTVHQNGTVDLDSAEDWNGQTSVTFRAEDTFGSLTEAIGVVTVTPVNDAPVITSTPLKRVLVGERYTYQLLVVDVDDDVPGYYLVEGPENMTILTNGSVVWTSDMDHIGGNTVSIRVTDGIVEVWQNFTLVVEREGWNNLPVIQNDPELRAYVGYVYKYDVDATDVDNDTLGYWLEDGPLNMTMDRTTGLLTWTPVMSEVGNVTITINVSDPFGSVEKVFVIQVFPEGANTPPTIGTINDVSLKGKKVTITLSDAVQDPDEPPMDLIWRIETSSPDLFTAEVIGNILTITPIKDAEGESTIKLVVRDSGGLEDEVTINVSVERPVTPEPGLFEALVENCLLLVGILIVAIVIAIVFFIIRSRSTGTAEEAHQVFPTAVAIPIMEGTEARSAEAIPKETEPDYDEQKEIDTATTLMERVFNTLIKNNIIEDHELDATLKGAAKKEQVVNSATVNEYGDVVLEPVAGVALEDLAHAYSRILEMALLSSMEKDEVVVKRRRTIELASGVMDGELGQGALVLGRCILKGAIAARIQTGIPGFDELLGGGLPKGSALLIQMPMGAEKDLLVMQLAKAGMVSNQGVLVTLSDSSPERFYENFEKVNVKPEAYADKGGLRIVDWNTYKTKRVRDVEEDGAIVRSSKGITNLGIALTDAAKALDGEEVKRAIVDFVSSAVKIFGMDTGYRFLQTMVAKLKEMEFTSVFVIDKDMHEDEEIGTISQTFDGVIDIERTREGKRIVTEIMVLSLSKPGYSSDVKIIEITERGLVIKDD